MRIFASVAVLFVVTIHQSFGQLSLQSVALASFSDSIMIQVNNDFTMLTPSKGDHQTEPSVMLRQSNTRGVTPFFCRLEDRITQSSKVNFRFRLGSVDYVNALEGKSYFEAVSYSKATNLYMRTKR